MKTRPNFRDRQRGAVAIIVALSITVLVGFVGLALDSGKLFVSKTELQNAADSCALSASAALTGVDSNQLITAGNWGKTAGDANAVGFQGTPINVIPAQDVTFSETLNGSYLAEGSVAESEKIKMRFAKCTLARSDIKTWFIQVLNILPGVDIGDQTVSSMGAASLRPSQTTCALPVAVCSAKIATINKGDWIESVVDGSDNITGDFLWVNYEKSGSAKAIKDTLTGAGVCDVPTVGEQVGAPGSKNGATAAWNTRFGIYAAAYKDEGDGIPDFTGRGYTRESWWPDPATPLYNAYAGASPKVSNNFQQARALNDQFEEKGSGIKLVGNPTIFGPAKLKAAGSDRRLGIVPVVDCTEYVKDNEAPIESFACILMLHPIEQGSGGPKNGARMTLEYLGPANSLTSPCASIGLPGGPGSAGPLVPALVQ